MPANTSHESVVGHQPDDPTMKIWRYMSLPKLIHCLQTRQLHFASLRSLVSDPYEGTLPTKTQLLNYVSTIRGPGDYPGNIVADLTRFAKENSYVNCWSGNQEESAAMWRLYGAGAGATAIQSTYGRLTAALSDTYYVGMVRYINYQTDMFPSRNLLNFVFHKRLEFEFEKEVRAVTIVDPGTSTVAAGVDPSQLIERAYIRSTEEQWIRDLIVGILDQYGLADKIAVSNFDRPPQILSVPEHIKDQIRKLSLPGFDESGVALR